MGDHFAGVWQSNHCPTTLKKMIFRTVIEEIIVRTDQDKKALELVIHWKGGAHTQLAMERPRSATETTTPMEALEIIRRMAVRYGDDQIASVLSRCGYSTGKGKRWNQIRVATARRNHSIAGQQRALPDPERVSLSEAARICGVSPQEDASRSCDAVYVVTRAFRFRSRRPSRIRPDRAGVL